MEVIIQKYLVPADENETQNLFGLKCDFIDRITITKFLKASFPIFKSEYYYQDNIQHLKAGEFELTLSNLGNDLSEIEHQSVYEFFNYGDPTETGREKYLVIMLISPNKKPAGIIRIDTLKVSQKETILNFATTSLEKEFTDWLDMCLVDDLGPTGQELDWETEYLSHHFKNIRPTGIIGDVHVRLNSLLNINTITAKQVIVRTEFQAQLFLDGLNRGYSVWAGLKSFMINWGITISLNFSGFSYYEPRFDLTLRWRSQSVNNAGVIDKYIDYEKAMQVSDLRWIFIQSGELVNSSNNPAVKHYVGILFDKTSSYMGEIEPYPSTRIGYNSENPVKPIFQVLLSGGTVKDIPAEKVMVINSGFHAKSWRNWQHPKNPPLGSFDVNIIYPRIATHKYDPGIFSYGGLAVLGMSEYRYLLSGATGRRNLILYDEKDIVVGTEATISGKQYICERINSYDDFNKKLETEWKRID